MSKEYLDLTSGPVYQHLFRLAIPASMGMIFNTLYNLTDFWFAGLLSNDALAGVAIAGSVFFLLLAIGIGMQTGVSAIIAPVAGQKQLDEVANWLDHAVGLGLVLSLITLLLGWLIAGDLVVFLGAEANIAPLANRYLSVTFAGAPAFVLSFVAAGALMALGDTASNRNALAVGFFANFLLNPLLTFVLDMGVAGLALATVLIKLASSVYLFWVLSKRLGRVAHPRFSLSRWVPLLRQVLPASMNMLTIILGGFITVSFIGRFGSDHVAGYALGLRLEQVLLLPALGLNTAVMSICGQNFGVDQYARVIESYKKGLIIGLLMAAVSIPVMVFLSPLMIGVFTDSEEIKATGASYLRIDAIAFYGYVVLFMSVAVLQSIKQPLFPMFLGIARQLVLPASMNYVLIIVFEWPMISMFYTIVSVVVLSAVVSHWYTGRQLAKLNADGNGI